MVRSKPKAGQGKKPHTKNGRPPTPEVDRDVLMEALTDHVKTTGIVACFAFHQYAAIPVGNAVNGKGLLAVAALIIVLLHVNSSGMYKYLDLKWCFSQLGLQFQDLKPESRPLDRWAGDLAERCMCVLAHLRRIATSTVRWRQCARTLADDSVRQLRFLVGLISGLDEDDPEPADAKASTEAAPSVARRATLDPDLDLSPPPRAALRNKQRAKADDAATVMYQDYDEVESEQEAPVGLRRKPVQAVAVQPQTPSPKPQRKPEKENTPDKSAILVAPRFYATYAKDKSYLCVALGDKKPLSGP
jgi:hypothetical protein